MKLNTLILSLLQLESVAECASRLRLLSKALDANELRLDGSFSSWRQELIQLQGAGLWLDMKESLLEASGLVLSANNQLDPQQSGKQSPSHLQPVFGLFHSSINFNYLRKTS